MDWSLAIRNIAATQGWNGTSSAEFRTLLSLLIHEDVLVAYAAKEKLRNFLVGADIIEDTQCVNEVVKCIMMCSTRIIRLETSGFRFQLLRQLLTTEAARGGDSGDDHDDSERVTYPYLEAVLNNMQQVETMMCNVLVPIVSSESGDECSEMASFSDQYEAFVFLSDLLKCCHDVDFFQLVALSKLMIMLMKTDFVVMDYTSQPTFVSCAVLTLLVNFQELMASWKEEGGVELMYPQWLDVCLAWLLQSSCTSKALRQLNSNDPSNVASQEAFIGQSSRYPFLQQWFLCLSCIGVAIVEAVSTGTTNDTDTSQVVINLASGESTWKDLELPHRQQLFAVLSEQDDVMIEVLNRLTRVLILANTGSKVSGYLAHFASRYDPNLLFADFVDTIGRDHLVVLDLLVSNETKMLEYIMRYLRHLNESWIASKQRLQSDGRLDQVMSVLIRLRLEIDRLVSAELFPYRAGPLTKRLLVIEELYEEDPSGDDVVQL